MKLSAYHKQKGDNVEMLNHLGKYDRVYCSKTFTFSPDVDDRAIIQCNNIVKCGTGYEDYTSKFSDEIEHIYPDYSLYNIENTAYGFLTRGVREIARFALLGKKRG